MLVFVARRVGQSLVTIFCFTIAYFFAYREFIPNNFGQALLPANATPGEISRFDASSPLHQYLHIIGMWLTGDLGYSVNLNRPISSVLAQAGQTTLVLITSAILLGLAIGVPTGTLRALWHGRAFDRISGVVCAVLSATPVMFGGILLVEYLTVDHAWLPPEGPQAANLSGILGDYVAIVIPVVSLSAGFGARVAMVTRSTVLDQMGSEYFRAAQACGVSRRRLMTRHVARNAAIPVIVFTGVAFPVLLSAAVVVETLFNMRGLGFEFADAMGGIASGSSRHLAFEIAFPILFVICVGVVVVSLLVDMVLLVVDPRITRSG